MTKEGKVCEIYSTINLEYSRLNLSSKNLGFLYTDEKRSLEELKKSKPVVRITKPLTVFTKAPLQLSFDSIQIVNYTILLMDLINKAIDFSSHTTEICI